MQDTLRHESLGRRSTGGMRLGTGDGGIRSAQAAPKVNRGDCLREGAVGQRHLTGPHLRVKNITTIAESKNNHIVRQDGFRHRYDTADDREVFTELWHVVIMPMNSSPHEETCRMKNG